MDLQVLSIKSIANHPSHPILGTVFRELPAMMASKASDDFRGAEMSWDQWTGDWSQWSGDWSQWSGDWSGDWSQWSGDWSDNSG